MLCPVVPPRRRLARPRAAARAVPDPSLMFRVDRAHPAQLASFARRRPPSFSWPSDCPRVHRGWFAFTHRWAPGRRPPPALTATAVVSVSLHVRPRPLGQRVTAYLSEDPPGCRQPPIILRAQRQSPGPPARPGRRPVAAHGPWASPWLSLPCRPRH